MAYYYEFLLFTLGQGMVMALQNRYQSTRHYVRKCLGHASDVDVESSETLVEKPADLKILIPLLLVLYVIFKIKFFVCLLFC